jgi:hypothetical protein
VKLSPLIVGTMLVALAGCDKAGAPANGTQSDRPSQQTASPAVALWSTEFKTQTMNECIQRATSDGNSEGVRKCKCVIEKASTTIPEQRFKSIQTDPQVKDMIKQIGAAC